MLCLEEDARGVRLQVEVKHCTQQCPHPPSLPTTLLKIPFCTLNGKQKKEGEGEERCFYNQTKQDPRYKLTFQGFSSSDEPLLASPPLLRHSVPRTTWRAAIIKRKIRPLFNMLKHVLPPTPTTTGRERHTYLHVRHHTLSHLDSSLTNKEHTWAHTFLLQVPARIVQCRGCIANKLRNALHARSNLIIARMQSLWLSHYPSISSDVKWRHWPAAHTHTGQRPKATIFIPTRLQDGHNSGMGKGGGTLQGHFRCTMGCPHRTGQSAS